MLVSYYLLRRLMVPKIYYLLMLGAAASVVIAIIINFKWKIKTFFIPILNKIKHFRDPITKFSLFIYFKSP